jgi:hypothetical protein
MQQTMFTMQWIRDTSWHSRVAARSALFQVNCPLFITLQRHNTENSKQMFPEKELRGRSPNFHVHVSVSDLSTLFPKSICLFCCRKICGLPGNIKIAHRHMNVEIGTGAAQFPEKEYINCSAAY